MEPIKKVLHLVRIYYLNNSLFVVSAVELPPIFVWTEVNPVIKIQAFTNEKLALAIDSAREASKSRFDPNHTNSEIRQWDDESSIWNHATKSWSIWWREDGSISVDTLEPGKMYRGAMEWRKVSDTPKNLPSQVSSQKIAQEILDQVQT